MRSVAHRPPNLFASATRLAALALLAAAFAPGCAESVPPLGIPDRGPAQLPGRDLTDIVEFDVPDDVPQRDVPRFPDAVDEPEQDTGPDTVDPPDVALDVPADAPTEVRDTGGPCTGLGCPCTASTRSTVCGVLACVDGVCCESGCGQACHACNVPGSEGTCAPHPNGTDPDGDCAADAASTCGRNGMCDGAGGCARYGAETPCNDGEACSVGDRCDGSGGCRGEVPSTCGPGPGNQCCVGTCSDGTGCATAAGACADTCGASELVTGATCGGCGAAGAVGTCTGGVRYPCTQVDHALCREVSCGGTRYFCTNEGGTWAWRPTATCSDGNACTFADRCVGGTCGGTAIDCSNTTCAERACNGTSTCTVTPRVGIACEDGNLCTYNDRCDASGNCVGGGTLTCADAPCVDRECTGGPTCSETILTGSACSDGNACTYDDRCGASGACIGGPAIDCSGRDTACLAYSCDGSPTCASRPINVGGVCDDGNPATDLDRCSAAGVCVGDTGCPPPSDACAHGTQNRRGCGNARVISRLDAGDDGWLINSDTCSAYDEFDDSTSCWDANADHTYRLYMRQGETATIRYQTFAGCSTSTWSGTLKIFENTGCNDLGCRTKVYCDYNKRDQTANYTAPRDGWIIIVADGSSAFDDEGSYRLTVRLVCRGGNCSCR